MGARPSACVDTDENALAIARRMLNVPPGHQPLVVEREVLPDGSSIRIIGTQHAPRAQCVMLGYNCRGRLSSILPPSRPRPSNWSIAIRSSLAAR